MDLDAEIGVHQPGEPPERPAEETVSGTGRATLDLLDDLADALSWAEESLDALDSAETHQRHSGESDEDHAIRIAQSRMARDRAVEMRENLKTLRAEAAQMSEHSRAVRAASRARTDAVLCRQAPLAAQQQAAQQQAPPSGASVAGLAGGDLAGAHPRATGTLDPTGVLGTLEAASETLHVDADVEQTLHTVVAAALRAIPSAERVGVSLRERGEITARAPSDALVAQVDQVQSEFGEGPCVDAVQNEEVVLVNDLSTASRRWPKFAPRAHALGIRALVAFPLITSSRSPNGALNLHATHPGAFSDEDLVVGQLFAMMAALALEGAATAHGLRQALSSRDLIGQAKGILMAQRHIDAEQAWSLLRTASQDTNVKLTDVARWTVDTLAGETEHHR